MISESAQTDQSQQNVNESKGPEFAIQRIYIKDFSLEVPSSPQIFLDKWEPELHLDLGTKAENLGNDIQEVILTVTVTVKLKEKTAFLVEVKQAGIFTLKGFPEQQLRMMLGAFCPNLLFPYAREMITNSVTRAGFPHLYLMPVNFDALFQEHEKKRQEQLNNAANSSQSEDDQK